MPQTDNVLGIDPAPSRPSSVARLVAGKVEIRSHSVAELREVLAQASASSTLVCWDAPLTGPFSVKDAGARPRDFSTRQIESFFRSASGIHPPKGISVRGYSGCPHWTITRNLVGLPIVGPHDDPNPSGFRLVTSDNEVQGDGPRIVEVHPALALWLWACWDQQLPGSAPEMYYKGLLSALRQAAMVEAQSLLAAGMQRVGLSRYADMLNPEWDDDELDAFIALVLGLLIQEKNEAVSILGDAASGCFLLPAHRDLQPRWERFKSSTEPRTK